VKNRLFFKTGGHYSNKFAGFAFGSETKETAVRNKLYSRWREPKFIKKEASYIVKLELGCQAGLRN